MSADANPYAIDAVELLREKMAQDPRRIDPLLADLAAVWKRHPDMRFMYLLMIHIIPEEEANLSYLDDSVLQKRLRTILL